jgi:SET domain-containing protein
MGLKDSSYISSSTNLQRCSTITENGGTLTVAMEEEAEKPPEPSNRQYSTTIEETHSDFDDNDSVSSNSSAEDVKSSSEEEMKSKFEKELIDCTLPQFSSPPSFSYVNPKVVLNRSSTGRGLFASVALYKDEVLISWSGKIVHLNEVLRMKESERTYILQIDEELFQVPPWKGYNEPADFTNHSCDPNAGFKYSPITLVAMRDIAPGEEVTFDYSMCECVNGLKGNEFVCSCGSPHCRGMFTGNDWKIPDLWNRYGDYFSPYLRDKIKKYREEMNM